MWVYTITVPCICVSVCAFPNFQPLKKKLTHINKMWMTDMPLLEPRNHTPKSDNRKVECLTIPSTANTDNFKLQCLSPEIQNWLSHRHKIFDNAGLPCFEKRNRLRGPRTENE
jgi:hypothetical protein